MYEAACTVHTVSIFSCTVYVVYSFICRTLDSPCEIQISLIQLPSLLLTSGIEKTTGYFWAAQYAMMGINRNSVFPPPACLKATPLVAVLLEVVIWKFISME